jgi:hypothetical protein
MRTGRLLVACAAFSASTCVAAESAPLRVFGPGELSAGGYTVVERLWVGSWRAAFWLPGHADSGAAIAALEAEARRLGAEALANVYCLADRGARFDAGGPYYCYGLAIRLR